MSVTPSENEIRELILKYAAINASKYGKAEFKSVMGKIISERPELKAKARDIVPLVREIVEEFEALPSEEKKRLIEKYGEKEEVKEKKKLELPPLPNAEKGKVVMRFAPNPNGPATLGSARGMIVNGEYARVYDGKLVIRFDDTDPRTKRPMLEAYDWYLEDLEWLGYKADEVVYASKRIPVYYEHVEKLIEMGYAYACLCKRDEFKRYRDAGIECPHRNLSPEESMEVWQQMLDGKLEEGEAVIRIKTDMKHKDPAIRDWVAFRIIYESHPLVGDKYVVYPTLDFESAIEDHLCNITHIIRGKDLIDSERRQKYIYAYFGWEYPVTKHWGRVKIHEFGKLSTSTIRKEIEKGTFKGWDDPRVPTLRAIRRRGFESEAIRNFFLSLGVGENDVSVSMKNLYAENRKIIDEKANRYFFVEKPVLARIEGLETGELEVEVELPLNPAKGGIRRLKASSEVFISENDMQRFEEGDVVRLKEFCNVKLVDKEKNIFEFVGKEMEGAKKGKNIIHWLPPADSMECLVLGSERDYYGKVEKAVIKEKGKVVQFERFAFCRIEGVFSGIERGIGERGIEETETGELVRAIYTHP
ncbi:MAG: glutamate--tRNA ligase [Archaeoglobus sp.]|nr:glutamate--tRNA ligase [Archaeoglobus sp.]